MEHCPLSLLAQNGYFYQFRKTIVIKNKFNDDFSQQCIYFRTKNERLKYLNSDFSWKYPCVAKQNNNNNNNNNNCKENDA